MEIRSKVKIIPVRVSQEEKEDIELMAKIKHKNVSEYLRDLHREEKQRIKRGGKIV